MKCTASEEILKMLPSTVVNMCCSARTLVASHASLLGKAWVFLLECFLQVYVMCLNFFGTLCYSGCTKNHTAWGLGNKLAIGLTIISVTKPITYYSMELSAVCTVAEPCWKYSYSLPFPINSGNDPFKITLIHFSELSASIKK
jgi:hypothetical protein